MKKLVVVDLDGTLTCMDHRMHLILGGNPNWSLFYKQSAYDTPRTDVIETVNLLKNKGTDILILTGRSDEVENETREWLHDNGVYYDYLIMRRDGDKTPDIILKKENLDKYLAEQGYTKKDVLCMFEDRDRVVDMWRNEGYTCFQVVKSNN